MTVTLNRGSITSLMSSSQAVSTLQPVASELKTQLENKLKSESAEKTREVLWQQYYASNPPDHAVLEVWRRQYVRRYWRVSVNIKGLLYRL